MTFYRGWDAGERGFFLFRNPGMSRAKLPSDADPRSSQPPIRPVKILVVADLHYTLKQWDWVRTAAVRFDRVIIAGDLLDIGRIVPLEAQIVVVRKYLGRIAATTPLLICSGNHDILESPGRGEHDAAWLQDERRKNLRVDGDRAEDGDLVFSVLPWWDGPEARTAIERQLARDQPRSRRWIWIYHAPPAGSPVAWDGRRDFGDRYLPDWIGRYQPWLVLGGHIHNAPFVKGGAWTDLLGTTRVLNPGKQPGPAPTAIVIDTSENTARWASIEGEDEVGLMSPAGVRT